MIETSSTLSPELISRLELQEAYYWSDYFRAANPEISTQCGIQLHTIDNAHLNIAAGLDVLAFNRVIGLGMEKPASSEDIDQIIATYSEAGTSRFFIQLSPFAKPAHLPDLLERKGFQYYNNWVKLYRELSPLPEKSTSLRIEVISTDKADIFADIIIKSFEWPAVLKPVIAATVGRNGWQHYLAYDGDTPVACAASFIDDIYASLAFAATLPAYRGLGAQSALITRRFNDCAALGCRWMIVETAEDLPDRPVASYRNMIRFGFREVYRRRNYLFTL